MNEHRLWKMQDMICKGFLEVDAQCSQIYKEMRGLRNATLASPERFLSSMITAFEDKEKAIRSHFEWTQAKYESAMKKVISERLDKQDQAIAAAMDSALEYHLYSGAGIIHKIDNQEKEIAALREYLWKTLRPSVMAIGSTGPIVREAVADTINESLSSTMEDNNRILQESNQNFDTAVNQMDDMMKLVNYLMQAEREKVIRDLRQAFVNDDVKRGDLMILLRNAEKVNVGLRNGNDKLYLSQAVSDCTLKVNFLNIERLAEEKWKNEYSKDWISKAEISLKEYEYEDCARRKKREEKKAEEDDEEGEEEEDTVVQEKRSIIAGQLEIAIKLAHALIDHRITEMVGLMKEAKQRHLDIAKWERPLHGIATRILEGSDIGKIDDAINVARDGHLKGKDWIGLLEKRKVVVQVEERLREQLVAESKDHDNIADLISWLRTNDSTENKIAEEGKRGMRTLLHDALDEAIALDASDREVEVLQKVIDSAKTVFEEEEHEDLQEAQLGLSMKRSLEHPEQFKEAFDSWETQSKKSASSSVRRKVWGWINGKAKDMAHAVRSRRDQIQECQTDDDIHAEKMLYIAKLVLEKSEDEDDKKLLQDAEDKEQSRKLLRLAKKAEEGFTHILEVEFPETPTTPADLKMVAKLKEQVYDLSEELLDLHLRSPHSDDPSAPDADDPLSKHLHILLDFMMSYVSRGLENWSKMLQAEFEDGQGSDERNKAIEMSKIGKVQYASTHQNIEVAESKAYQRRHQVMQEVKSKSPSKGVNTSFANDVLVAKDNSSQNDKIRKTIDLFKTGKILKSNVFPFIEDVVSKLNVKYAPTSLTQEAQEVQLAKCIFAPLKGFLRIVEKLILRPAGGDPWDVVRVQIECPTLDMMLDAVEMISEDPNVQVIEINDRFERPTAGGWADISMYVSWLSDDCKDVVAEIQLVHSEMMTARKGLKVNDSYDKGRFESELRTWFEQPTDENTPFFLTFAGGKLCSERHAATVRKLIDQGPFNRT